jgi:hypothetical protein
LVDYPCFAITFSTEVVSDKEIVMRNALNSPFTPGSDIVPEVWAGRIEQLSDWRDVVRPRRIAGLPERGRTILGEAGLGKSTLVRRIARDAAAAGDWVTPQLRIPSGAVVHEEEIIAPGGVKVPRLLPIAVYLTGLPDFASLARARTGATFARRFKTTMLARRWAWQRPPMRGRLRNVSTRCEGSSGAASCTRFAIAPWRRTSPQTGPTSTELFRR